MPKIVVIMKDDNSKSFHVMSNTKDPEFLAGAKEAMDKLFFEHGFDDVEKKIIREAVTNMLGKEL